MMLLETKFEIGQTVYLKTEKDQTPRLITRILVTPTGVLYSLACGITDSMHYEIEISEQVNVLLSTTH